LGAVPIAGPSATNRDRRERGARGTDDRAAECVAHAFDGCAAFAAGGGPAARYHHPRRAIGNVAEFSATLPTPCSRTALNPKQLALVALAA
jgi:hypothetical protein